MNIEIKYIGVISLLGRLKEHIDDSDEIYMIDNAVEDFLKSEVGERFIIIENSHHGFSVEPRPKDIGRDVDI